MSGGELEEYDEEEEYSKQQEDSTTNLNHNQDISGIVAKPRPKTAKAKNEEDNIFYRR